MSNAVLVSNLSPSIDSSMLEDMFSLIGNVRKAVIKIDAVSGRSQGFGVVEMSTAEEARNCVLHFNGQRREGSILIVREQTSLVSRSSIPESSRSSLKKLMRNAGRKVKRVTI